MLKTILHTGILGFLPFLLLSQVQQLELLSNWTKENLVASRAHDNTYNEIWGIAINDREFAIIGSTAGTHIIDVTNPRSPEEVQFVPGKAQGTGIIHRDYHDFGCYLYAVCDEGPSSLQIIDISQLPDTVIIEYDSDNLIQRSHNIFIDTTNALLYSGATNGSTIGGAALAIFDISDPISPQFIRNYNQFGSVNIGHVHDAYVENNIAYLNCGRDGFVLGDFTDPNNMVVLSSLNRNEYPFAGYNHSGWPSTNGEYYYMADEDWGHPMKVLDVRDKSNAQSIATFDADTMPMLSIPHNQVVACDYLYVSYYFDGLQVYDISNPSEPKRAFHYPTSKVPHANVYRGAWGVYPFLPSGIILVSDMQDGLFVVEAVNPCGYVSHCEEISTSTLSTTEGNLSIYPNPINHQVTIAVDNQLVAQGIVKITNLSGIVIYEGLITGSKIEVDATNWSTGLYIVEVINQEQKLSSTIVKH